MNECKCIDLMQDEDTGLYVCLNCSREYEAHGIDANKYISNTEGVGCTYNEQHERGDTMSFDTSSLPSNNTVSRDEAGAWIAEQAETQGIGNSFKVYYGGNIVGKLEDLPERVVLADLRVSAALDQAHGDDIDMSWFTWENEAFAVASLV